MTRTLTEANENSIWGKLYQNKMDGSDSFYPFKNGLEHILNKSKVAYLQNGEQIRYFEDYHCKVRTINIGGLTTRGAPDLLENLRHRNLFLRLSDL